MPEKSSTSPAAIFHRTAVPFLLFAAVLAAALGMSKAVVLPGLLSVEIAGSVRNVQELKTYHDALQQRIQVKQEQRDALILPMKDTGYRRLADWKHGQYDLRFLLSSVSQTAKSIPADTKGSAVRLSSVRYHPIDNLIEVRGDVRNVGPRSMTVLAQFVERLQDEPFVENIQHPTFERVEDPERGFLSPFQLTITLQ